MDTLLDDLLKSWCRQLRGARKSDSTIKIYRTAVTAYLDYCTEQGFTRELNKSNVVSWMESQADLESSTARLRLTAVKLFARWLATEEGFDVDGVLAVVAPKLDQKPVPDLEDDDVRRMIKACDGTALLDKRDKAMLILLAETGLRAAELLALDRADIDLEECVLVVRRGKGGKSRRTRFSAGAAAAIDRYCRARSRAVRKPSEGPLWLSYRGTRLTYNGLQRALKRRAVAAGVTDFHAHRLRHTMAVRWMSSGGSESGLMSHAGWSSRMMIDRYVKTASERLAGEEFQRLGLGYE